jgi:hypothetical protein
LSNKIVEVKLEYRPCNCPKFEQSIPVEGDDDERETPAAHAPEHFEREGIAARRLKEHVSAGRTPRVHHQGLHVKVAWINGEKYSE